MSRCPKPCIDPTYLQYVKLHHLVFDLQRSLQDGRRLKNYKHLMNAKEMAVGIAFSFSTVRKYDLFHVFLYKTASFQICQGFFLEKQFSRRVQITLIQDIQFHILTILKSI